MGQVFGIRILNVTLYEVFTVHPLWINVNKLKINIKYKTIL